MARTEHYHDPDAPTANSIVVAVSVFVTDQQGLLLLVKRDDNGVWSLPGGGQEIGEYVAETAVRATLAATGVLVEVAGVVGVYSDPSHVIEHADGEVRQQLSLCFRARPLTGVSTPSGEPTAMRWVTREELSRLSVHPSTMLRIKHGYEDRREAYVG
ncbi:NUDIX domain-containing protein [Micromonospora sp. NBC_00389]|uniref:NUDIX hydrolase n=1 Tax=Micromonospora sp. NBC_00389 TaxID=2903586 RepID=UPI002E2191F0